MIRQDLDNCNLPTTPGVYFWRDGAGKILYIGKATNLRDRTRSYFAPDLIKTRGPHMVDMVFKSTIVTWEQTDSVLEALILEANLIKKHQPYYNKQERDDKSFNCVAITKEELPRILLIRQKDINTRDKTITPLRVKIALKYDVVFGPFPSGSSIKEALSIIRKIFPFRDRVSAQKDKEAFYQQIALSPDVSNSDSAKLYRKNIGRIKLILQGKLKYLIKELRIEMNKAAKDMRFEEAELLKFKVFSLEHIQDVSLIKRDLVTGNHEGTFRIEAYDIAHISGSNMVGVMTVVENAQSAKNEYRKFIVRGFTKANDAGALKEILTRRFGHLEWPLPNALVVDGNAIQSNVANEVLSDLGFDIPIIAVTKDERHRPKAITGPQEIVETHKYAILLANNESHRFATTFHKARRSKSLK